MKLFSVFFKSLREQVRSYWLLLLSLLMGPFFIFVYYLIVESSKPTYEIVFVNNDAGMIVSQQSVNYGSQFIDAFNERTGDSVVLPFFTDVVANRESGVDLLKTKNADALIIIPESFSISLHSGYAYDSISKAKVEFIGDLTSVDYLISAVYVNDLLNEFVLKSTSDRRLVKVSETALGSSGRLDDFSMVVPGILIVSIIMLMFTASIAFVSEVENKTILRLKLSRVNVMEFLAGVGLVQVLVGVVSVFLTLSMAIMLGFEYQGSLGILLIVAILTSISIIAFSLIIAAVTKSANEVLIAGNFPMFLFMFFTGAAFPMQSEALFTLAGYPFTVQGLMTPVHAISALNKALVMNMGLADILPELIALLLLTALYFTIGALVFKHRHMRVV